MTEYSIIIIIFVCLFIVGWRLTVDGWRMVDEYYCSFLLAARNLSGVGGESGEKIFAAGNWYLDVAAVATCDF